jgi:hypothetical protein
MPACISSLTDIELGQLDYSETKWFVSIREQMRKFGYTLGFPKKMVPGRKYIKIVMYEDWGHAVISNHNGKVLHNPLNKLMPNEVRKSRKYRFPEDDYYIQVTKL